MSNEAFFDGYQSPPMKNVSQGLGASNHYYESTPPLSQSESEARRQRPVSSAAPGPRPPAQHPYRQTSFNAPPPYAAQPPVNAPYYPPMQHASPPQPQVSSLYYQRPGSQVSSIVRCRPLLPRENVLTLTAELPLHATDGNSAPITGSQPLAAPSLHLAIVRCLLPAVAGALHLPDMQQGFLAAELPAYPQPLAHGRKAVQVPAHWLRQGVQCAQQHETTREGLSQHVRQPWPYVYGLICVDNSGNFMTSTIQDLDNGVHVGAFDGCEGILLFLSLYVTDFFSTLGVTARMRSSMSRNARERTSALGSLGSLLA